MYRGKYRVISGEPPEAFPGTRKEPVLRGREGRGNVTKDNSLKDTVTPLHVLRSAGEWP